MLQRRDFLLLALTPIALTSGCQKVKEQSKATKLDNASNLYRKAIRWGYYDIAMTVVDPKKPVNFNEDDYENIRVTSYEILQPAITDGVKAVQIMRLEYLLRDQQVIRKLTDRQTWRYDPEIKEWFLTSGFPKFPSLAKR